MIEIFDPNAMNLLPVSFKLGNGWHYPLDYSWVIQQIVDFTIPLDVVLDVGSLYSRLGHYLAENGYQVETLNRDRVADTTYLGEFLDYDLPKNYFSVIVWVSSIEHQTNMEDISKCVQKSMDLLAPGGVFLATFSLSTKTYWHHQTKGWLLTVKDAMKLFGENAVKGKYESCWEGYRDNKYGFRNAYVSRFDHWHEGSPDYIGAGVVKVKDHN